MMTVRKIMFSSDLRLRLQRARVADCLRMSRGALVLVVWMSSLSLPQNVYSANNDTVAVVGKKVITTEEFARRYKEKLIKYGLSDNGILREGYLHNIVDDEILIARAKSQNLNGTKEASAEMARLTLQELLDAYLAKHILSHVEVTDDDLKELFLKMNMKIKVRHLYAHTKEEADSLHDELFRGRSFDELAAKCFTDPQLKENGGSLGYISIDEMDPEFEKAAYAMRIGEISKPVKTVEGYSILRVDDIKQNPLVTVSEFLKARDRLGSFVRKRKREDAVKYFTSGLRKELNIQFKEPLISRLYATAQQQSLEYLIEKSSFSISRVDRKKAALTSTKGNWNIDNVIDALSTMPEKQRKWIHTKDDFEDVIAGLVMRKYIAETARGEKLDAAPSFHEKVDFAFDTYLLSTIEGECKKQIKFSSDSLKSYYAHNRDKYRTEAEIRLSGVLVDNSALADSIRRLLDRGELFDELARQFSLQTLTAGRGGDLGFYRKEELGRLGGELFGLSAGEWRGPIAEDGKFLFLKCTDRKGSVYKSFEESSKDIEELLHTLHWDEARSKYVESYKKKIDCRLYPERTMALSL
jgi:parvulin-like peptidyl-prolyl isomerase